MAPIFWMTLMPIMRAFRTVLFVLGLIGIGFGYWGAETRSGHRVFHEWNVVVPLFVGCVGALLLVAAGILSLVISLKGARPKK